MWLGFVVLTIIATSAMEQGKFPRVSAVAHLPIQVKLGGFSQMRKGVYAVPTGYMCLNCGKHLMQAYDYEGYVSDTEPCTQAQQRDSIVATLLQRLMRFEEFNETRNTRSQTI